MTSLPTGNEPIIPGRIDYPDVGFDPPKIGYEYDKLYVSNPDSNTVSVIDGYNDSKTKDIRDIGKYPDKIYVANVFNRFVNHWFDQIYVVNKGVAPQTGNVSVINGSTYTKEPHDIPVGIMPMDITEGDGKIYVVNNGSNTISVIDVSTNTKERDISVGSNPVRIAYDSDTNMIYVVNQRSGSVSVINGATDKVAAGVIFNVNPANSGKIICNNTAAAPTNTYVYVDTGTNCVAQPNDPKDFEFNTWVESPLTNRNSSIPLNSPSGNLTVNRYGVFTVNFKQPHHLSNQELFTYLTGAIAAGVAVNGVVLLVPAWKRTKNQHTHLRECIDMIGNDKDKSQKNAIEDKILGYYVDGKLSEDHRQLLKDKISEYYDSVKGSEGYGAPFTRK
jgi:YVTN family beta-propeller protein